MGGDFDGNWGHLCRFPGSRGVPNKAGGELNELGYTVTWQCAKCDVEEDMCTVHNGLKKKKRKEACAKDARCVLRKKGTSCIPSCRGKGLDPKKLKKSGYCNDFSAKECKDHKPICKLNGGKCKTGKFKSCKKVKHMDDCCNLKACQVGPKKCEESK